MRSIDLTSLSRIVLAVALVCTVSVWGTVSFSQTLGEISASAKSAVAEGRFKDAVALYSDAIKANANQSALYFERAAAYEMINQPQKAIEDYRKATELEPGNNAALESLAGLCERKLGRFDTALKLYRQALETAPTPETKERLRANIAILENRLQPDTSSPVRNWHLGNLSAAAGDLSKAEVFYTKAIRIDPSMFQAYFSRGLLRMKAGYINEALKDFEETVRISPSLRGAYVQKGLAHQRLGNNEQARKDFENAALMDPRDPEALFYFAGALEEKKELQEALQKYVEAMERRPKPELKKLIQERITALGSVPKADLTGSSKPKTRDLW